MEPSQLLQARARFFQAVREFYTGRGFLEVVTPSLLKHCEYDVNNPQFETQVLGPDGHELRRAYLPISPEYQMKALLSEYPGSIFQIAQFFRNGNFSSKHSPSFFGVEWYELGADYHRSMQVTELAICHTLERLGRERWTWGGSTVDGRATWRKVDVCDAVCDLVGLDLANLMALPALEAAMRGRGYYPAPEKLRAAGKRLSTWEDHFDWCVDMLLEERRLSHHEPTFLMNFPSSHELGEMGEKVPGQPNKVQRFELYICGVELCNGHTELTSRDEMGSRFDQIRAAMPPHKSRDAYPDLGKISARIPACSGVAIGLDRLFMITLGLGSIHEIYPPAVRADLLAPEDVP